MEPILTSHPILVKTFPVGSFQCNCTILADEKTGEALVIDPGDEADKILSFLQKSSLKVKYLLHTHAHLDHIGATAKTAAATSAKIGLHKDDLYLYENIAMQGKFLGLQVDPTVTPVDHYLVNGDVIEWGKSRAEVLHTPGHTPGSLTFKVDGIGDKNYLFAGDTLFMGSIGRTDLWGGDFGQIMGSIKEKLLTAHDDTVVVCGHGPNTTIGRERKSNPFLINA